MSDYMIVLLGGCLAAVFAVLARFRPGLALLSCPLAVVMVLVKGIDIVTVIMASLVALATLVSAIMAQPRLETRPRLEKTSWLRVLIKTFFYILGVVIFLFFSLAVFGIYGFFMLTLGAALVVRYSLISRDTTTTHIISTIGASIRQNLPLAAALESAARGQKGKRRLIMQRISQWLTQGYLLSESLRRGYPKCPGYALAMITEAEKIQQVPQAVEGIEAQLSERSNEARKFQPANLAYPLVLMLAIFSFMCGMMVFVFPKFMDIYADMKQPLPAITQVVFLISRNYYSSIFVILAILILLVVPSALYLKFRPRRPERAYAVSRIGDFFKWHFPVLRWFERSFSLLQTVSFLRLSINAGSAVDQAIAGAAELDANACYRRRLGRWLDRVQGGQDVAEAARKSRVGSTLVWAFDQKVNQGNTPAILESLESFYRSHYSYITNLARYIFWPCVTIVMGLLVGLVVYAMVAPIAALIYHAADAVIP